MAGKEELYKKIKIAGFIFYIPFILISGPLGGYILGDYAVKFFHWESHTIFIFIIVGLLASLIETSRIIRMVIKMDEDSR